MKGATNMKKLLKLAGITIALTAIGVGVRAMYIPKKHNRIYYKGLNEPLELDNGDLIL